MKLLVLDFFGPEFGSIQNEFQNFIHRFFLAGFNTDLIVYQMKSDLVRNGSEGWLVPPSPFPNH